MMILLIYMTSTQITGYGQIDARIMENEAKIRENVRQYRDRKAISSIERMPADGKTHTHWLKGFYNALMLIIGRL